MSNLAKVIEFLIKSELKQGPSANRTYDLQQALDMLAESEQPATVAPQEVKVAEEEKPKKKEKSDV